MLLDAAEPPEPLDAADEPPLVPPVLLEDDPPGLEDDMPPPAEDPLVPPVAELGVSVDELDELVLGAGVVLVDDDDDEPPGTTTVSLVVSLVVVPADGLPPGTTVVVSFFSHAVSAKAATTANRTPLRFISTRLSS